MLAVLGVSHLGEHLFASGWMDLGRASRMFATLCTL